MGYLGFTFGYYINVDVLYSSAAVVQFSAKPVEPTHHPISLNVRIAALHPKPCLYVVGLSRTLEGNEPTSDRSGIVVSNFEGLRSGATDTHRSHAASSQRFPHLLSGNRQYIIPHGIKKMRDIQTKTRYCNTVSGLFKCEDRQIRIIQKGRRMSDCFDAKIFNWLARQRFGRQI